MVCWGNIESGGKKANTRLLAKLSLRFAGDAHLRVPALTIYTDAETRRDAQGRVPY